MPIPKIEPIKLTKETIKDLRDMGEGIAILQAELERAERVGIDVKDLRKRFEEAKKLREGLLKEYV